MAHLMAWCGFFGGWLLVAGPMYQATIELADEDFERGEFVKASASMEPPPPVSRWWLLVPPVAYILHLRRGRAHRHALLHVLTPLQVEQLLHFSETATAWMFVAGGAALIAVAETWHLREEYDWSAAVFWLLVAGMLGFCAANTALRVRRRHDILRQGGR